MNYLEIHNHQSLDLKVLPVLDYDTFYSEVLACMGDGVAHHCLTYFGIPHSDRVQFVLLLANDENHTIQVFSYSLKRPYPSLNSLTIGHPAFAIFEREIHEKHGIKFEGHPWLKPVRFPFDKSASSPEMDDYPFFHIDSKELHEVAVGPIHAGVIEPGHFRFICNGEKIVHLEIQLGYQHRGVEQLFLEKKKLNEKIVLSESIAGDTATAHASAFSWLWETMHEQKASSQLQFERTLAIELERMAIHTGDLAAICTDVAYQLGNAVLGRLRTPIVNFFQEWCGNRLAKGLIRPDFSLYRFSPELATRLLGILDLYEKDLEEVWSRIKTLPSMLSRLERTGVVTWEQATQIGAVGMAARMTGLKRDVRFTHPYGLYLETPLESMLYKRHGDVYSRTQLRMEEIRQSMALIRNWLSNPLPENGEKAHFDKPFPHRLSVSLVEGWRGEICHCAVTDEEGEVVVYKVKDPSMHNWFALALSVRENEISDFPVGNKSFDLSYCGFDL